ncbi:MAG: hypothetical protein LLF98_00235 [Clostridium sp.]|uniref:hypothetical protein n=1 Tax=Clostridium sp. TaxID=1506 RepID=UPI0025C34348|nr:hypothetical protein [Clostridium sp.]MCE5219725.1 hypothetical protein [Clostridium sp.]
MESNKIAKLANKHHNENNSNKKLCISEQWIKNKVPKNYKIYTPEIIIKYNNSFKTLLKLTNDKTKTKFIMYNKVCKWYENEESINFSMEKIYIKTKLGSYTSGGCGIIASLFAGLTASGIFSYMDNYIKRLGPFFLEIYVIAVLFFGVKILTNEDKKVEMYNMFLVALNNLENDKNEK